MFADAHLHMTDPEFDDGYDDMSDSALLFSCTSSEREWDRLSAISASDGRVVPFYGTHPWEIGSYRGKEVLAHFISTHPGANVGEIGLDTKHGELKDQMIPFREQLEVASEYERIAAIHIVGAENEVLSELRSVKVRSILHSYSCPPTYTPAFVKCGCYFSVSPRIFSRSSDKVVSILRSIPLDRILLETDAPSGHNNCIMMSEHAQDVGNALGMDAENVIEIALNNAKGLLSF